MLFGNIVHGMKNQQCMVDFSMDMSDNDILYMIDNDNYGYWDILRLNISCMNTKIDRLGYTHTDEWCTEIIYSCTKSQTFCQDSSQKTYFQAVAFDVDIRLFWWCGTASFTNKMDNSKTS